MRPEPTPCSTTPMLVLRAALEGEDFGTAAIRLAARIYFALSISFTFAMRSRTRCRSRSVIPAGSSTPGSLTSVALPDLTYWRSNASSVSVQ